MPIVFSLLVKTWTGPFLSIQGSRVSRGAMSPRLLNGVCHTLALPGRAIL